MEGLELTCFQIISNVGGARSCFIEAIQSAKQGNYEKAATQIQEGEAFFTEGHHAHATLIQKEANGELDSISLLLLHAEDQLMSAEAFKILAKEFIDVYQKIENK